MTISLLQCQAKIEKPLHATACNGFFVWADGVAGVGYNGSCIIE